MKSKKVNFTLLEITLALAILIIIASVTSVQIKKLVDGQRFQTQVQGLFSQIQQAQVLAATYQSDFFFEIGKDQKGFFYRCFTDEPLPSVLLSQKKHRLSQVKSIQKGKSSYQFTVYSGGRLSPQEVIRFSSTTERVLSIDLRHGHLVKFLHSLD